jgi:hypothetical protein
MGSRAVRPILVQNQVTNTLLEVYVLNSNIDLSDGLFCTGFNQA